jgi:hypothetical protein
MLFTIWTLRQICLLEFIWVEGGVKFVKPFGGGGQTIKAWEPLLKGYSRTSISYHSCICVMWMIPTLKITAFWNIAPCNLVGVARLFRCTYCLHHQGDSPLKRRSSPTRLQGAVSQKTLIFILVIVRPWNLTWYEVSTVKIINCGQTFLHSLTR